MIWKKLNTMQQSSCWQFQKLSLREVSSTGRNGATNVDMLKEPTLRQYFLIRLHTHIMQVLPCKM